MRSLPPFAWRSFIAVSLVGLSAALCACSGGSGAVTAIAPPLSAANENRAVDSPARAAAAVPSTVPEGERYGILYRFTDGNAEPSAPSQLIDVSGVLYGVTEFGGAGNGGVLYSLTPAGVENVVYSFGTGGPNDGTRPYAALTDVDGTLYGTTSAGGAAGYGTVFSMTQSGTETIIHSFSGTPADGATPSRRMIDVGGTLYGVTGATSKGNGGTVFSIGPAGAYTVLHVFPTGATDGVTPLGELVDVNGTLYGTTDLGGTNSLGTVYSISPTGNETVLYDFKGGSSDGAHPQGQLVDVNGTLYGTTGTGGTYNQGTVFSVSTTGAERVLYSFAGGDADGAAPNGNLIDVGGKLLGTTTSGGPKEYGAIFAITTAGAEKVLHVFSGSDHGGIYPNSGLLDIGSTLYGTTFAGGIDGGTVYSLRL